MYVYRQLIQRAGAIPSISANVYITNGSEIHDVEETIEDEQMAANNLEIMDAFDNNGLAYIAGNITKSVMTKLSCKCCADILKNNLTSNINNTQLITMPDLP